MKDIANYLYEIGTLKNAKRTGWWFAGVKDPESIAAHSHRAAVIAYILARLEGADEKRAALICIFHDNAEVRIGDFNKVNARYIDSKKAEKMAFGEQVSKLPEDISKDILGMFNEIEEMKTKEGIIAHDAEQLECAIQAKEYLEQGYHSVKDFIDNVRDKRLITKTAKELLKSMEKTSSVEWWDGLKKIPDDNK